jgi:hypothetical protein
MPESFDSDDDIDGEIEDVAGQVAEAHETAVLAVAAMLEGGTQAAWVTTPHVASPAATGRRLIIRAGFPADSPDRRRLEDRARALGFADLAPYLADRYLDHGHILLAIAHELGVTIHIVRGLRDALGIQPHGGIRARGRWQPAASDQRATARAAELGFASLREYLTDPLHRPGVDDPAARRRAAGRAAGHHAAAGGAWVC